MRRVTTTGAPERLVAVAGAELCVQTFGEPTDPTILLVHGACASLLWWDEDLCRRLAAGGRHVVRFDNRDTGRSTCWPPGAPGYTLRDLAEDAVGVLDALGVERAHLVGRSMAGAVVAAAAVAHPERVASLTLVATTPGDPGLSPMSDEFLAATAEPPDLDDTGAVVDHIVGVLRAYAGAGPFDEAAVRAVAEEDVRRSRSIASALINHFLIDLDAPGFAAVADLDVPTLIVHGDRDPVWPLDHAQALRRHLPDADLLVLAGVGHDLPAPTWPTLVPRLLHHTRGAP